MKILVLTLGLLISGFINACEGRDITGFDEIMTSQYSECVEYPDGSFECFTYRYNKITSVYDVWKSLPTPAQKIKDGFEAQILFDEVKQCFEHQPNPSMISINDFNK